MSKKKKNRSNRSPQTKNTNVLQSKDNIEENSVSEETVKAEENSEDNTAEEAAETVKAEENSEDNTAEEAAETVKAEENSEDNTAEGAAETAIVEVKGKTPDKADKSKKQRFYFVFAVVIFLFAAIGVVSSVVFTVNTIRSSVSNDPLKDEFSKFLLPVVGNDVAPFENYDEISNYAKINCSIWNILLNHDTSAYKLTETGEFVISEYDVDFSCKEIFGSSGDIVHRTVGATDMSFVYDSSRHVYSCKKDLRYLNYVPVIADMSESGGVYTLTVEYYLPAMLFLSENMGLETSAEKTMIYIIDHNNGKNTLIAVQFATDEVR